MAIGDPIADMLTRIRNAVRNRSKTVVCLNSKVCRGIATVLRDEGYIDGFDVIEDGRQGQVRIRLKYADEALAKCPKDKVPAAGKHCDSVEGSEILGGATF